MMSTGTLRRIPQSQIRDVKTKDKSEKRSNNNEQQSQSVSNRSSRVRDLCIQHIRQLNRTVTHSSIDDSFSTGGTQSTSRKRQHPEDEDDFLSNDKYSRTPSIEENFIPDFVDEITVPSYHNNLSTTYQTSSSITIMPADTSTRTSSQDSINQKDTTKGYTCHYTAPSANVSHCRNKGTYQCSHCNTFFCLQHGLQHQEDLKTDIRSLLTKTQELFNNIQQMNFIDVKVSCISQLDQWIATIHAKIDQIRSEIQQTLGHFEKKIHEKNAQLKCHLQNELERKVACILTEQLQEFEINKSQVEKAGSEFVRLENLFHSFNNRQLITMISNSDIQVNLNPPSFVCSDILIDELQFPENIQEKINNFDPSPQETRSASNPPKDNSNVSTKLNASTVANQNTEKTTEDTNTTTTNSFPTDKTDFFTDLFDEDFFESSIDNVMGEEVVSNNNNLQEQPRSKTPEPTAAPSATVAAPSLSQDSNLRVENVPPNNKDAKLDLSNQELSDQDMEVVIQYALENSKLTQPFRTLDISSNKIGSKGIHSLCDALAKNTTLTKLNVHGNRIHNRGAQYIGALLQKNSMLMELDIARNQIGHEGMIVLSNALKENKTLTVLNLEHNLIGHRGAQYVCSALEHNKTLQSLNLNGCGIEEIGAHYVSKVMKTTTSMKVLELAGNQLGETGLLCVVHALRLNATLTTLNLQLNRIGETGAFYLSDGLRKNKALRELNLAQNQIGDSGLRHICDALQQNTVLTALNISDNGIRKTGAQYIGRMLSINKTLTDLDCSSNDIQSEGSIHLREVLRTNKTLVNLNLQQNRIAQQGIKGLLTAIRDNHTLLTFNLKKNNITPADEAKLNEQLMENKKKKSLN